MRLIIVVICLLLSGQVFAAKIDLPRDANGWTVFTPSADSRIIYVDEAANGADDDDCTYYLPSDELIGADPFNPTGAITRCETMTKAISLTSKANRNTYPDWILFKRGGVYPASNIAMGTVHSGRSATEPMVFAAYGSTGDLPSLRFASGAYAWQSTGYSLSFIAFANLEWYADIVDPASENWKGAVANGGSGVVETANMTDLAATIRILTGIVPTVATKQGFLWEGNRFRYVSLNIQEEQSKQFIDSTFRRNTCLDGNSAVGQLSGYVSGWDIEENIWDHNGWYDPDFPATERGKRHNVYIGPGNGTVFKENIMVRPSSSALKVQTYNWLNGTDEEDSVHVFEVDDNLIVDANIAFGFFPNTGDLAYRGKDLDVHDNVVIHAGYTNASLENTEWYVSFDGLDGGSFTHNLFVHSKNITNNNALITWEGGTGHGGAWLASEYPSRNFTFSDNITVSTQGNTYGFLIVTGSITWDDMTFSGNKLISVGVPRRTEWSAIKTNSTKPITRLTDCMRLTRHGVETPIITPQCP